MTKIQHKPKTQQKIFKNNLNDYLSQNMKPIIPGQNSYLIAIWIKFDYQPQSLQIMGFPDGSAINNTPVMQEMQETRVWFLGQEDTLEEGMATHSQYSCLENPMHRGVWMATVHRVSKSWTGLSNWACIHFTNY